MALKHKVYAYGRPPGRSDELIAGQGAGGELTFQVGAPAMLPIFRVFVLARHDLQAREFVQWHFQPDRV